MLDLIAITTALFLAGLGLREVFKSLCALCFAFAGTWILLLFVGADPVALGIYMGASAAGFMYYLFAKLPQKFSIFKLPFLLSLFFLIRFSLGSGVLGRELLAMFLLWAAFILIFSLRNSPRLKGAAKKVIECCRNW